MNDLPYAMLYIDYRLLKKRAMQESEILHILKEQYELHSLQEVQNWISQGIKLLHITKPQKI